MHGDQPHESVHETPQPVHDDLVVWPAARPTRILIADDSGDGREMLAWFLEGEGYVVLAVDNGNSALKAISDFDPDIAILDIDMPGRSGHEVARAIRRRDASRPYLIALSGMGTARDKVMAHDSGFDQHFTKPVDPAGLLALLARQAT